MEFTSDYAVASPAVVLSGGRAEVVAGRSAFPEPFAPQVRAAIGKASPDKASTTA